MTTGTTETTGTGTTGSGTLGTGAISAIFRIETISLFCAKLNC